jgi:hypothetical protein
MKLKFALSVVIGLLAVGAQAAVIGDASLASGGDTFAAQAEKSRVDGAIRSADDSVALPEPDVALLVAGIGVIGFLAARRRKR